MVKIQVFEGEEWRQKAEEIGLEFRDIPATRGNIYAGDGSLMATSIPYYKVAMDPTRASKEDFKNGIDSLAMLLNRELDGPGKSYYKHKISKARKTGDQYLVISRKRVSHLQKKQMETWPIFRRGRMKGGVIFEKVSRRYLPFKTLGKRTIGSVNENGVGAGLEYSFNRELGGANGKALYRKVMGGRWRPEFDNNAVRPIDGKDLETTLDMNLQDVASSALDKALRFHKADYGCVIVMEVETGEIKVLVNLERNKRGRYNESYNYALGGQGLSEPGSTFKLASMIALFEETNLELEDMVETGNGERAFFDRIMRDSKIGGHGKISVREVFEKSSNIGISSLVDQHFGQDPKSFVDYIKEMGLTETLGTGMKGEGVSYIKSPDNKTWSGVTLPWMSVGYELKVTPLQTLAFYNAVANSGKMVRPVLVRRVFQGTKSYSETEPIVLRNKICSEETLKKVRAMLEGVVERGTARNIRGTHYGVAGKTGTSQKLVNGRYTKTYYTSFAGYFPADKPKYSCIVVIDDPKGYNQYGADVAAPVFKEVADKIYATDLDLQNPIPLAGKLEEGVFPVIRAGNRDDLATICERLGIESQGANDADWVRSSVNAGKLSWKPALEERDVVQDVRGMTLRDAIFLLENSGMRVHYRGQGRVANQSLSPGAKVRKGKQIYLTLE
ncbi:penicillin-binding protein [Fulvitalea axinellae]|uniref:Penicillin-binding protein n=1 Tax=Fulvitalea axinellae TaxID=1182444 RepID=A0AAU9DA52_9BACT|nr:penicillin-binding protein [Fulvitalea axinellae]